MYEYSCQLIRVINGNTIEADIDLGFNIVIKQKIRLFGINDTEETKAALVKNIPKEFVCRTVYNKRGKVGRVLGHVFKIDDDGNLIDICDQLVGLGIAKKFNS